MIKTILLSRLEALAYPFSGHLSSGIDQAARVARLEVGSPYLLLEPISPLFVTRSRHAEGAEMAVSERFLDSCQNWLKMSGAINIGRPHSGQVHLEKLAFMAAKMAGTPEQQARKRAAAR